MMFGGPGSPKAVIPHARQVEGRNCIGPRAPALDTPGLALSPLSIWPMAASTVQGSPGQYMAADSWNSGTYVIGRLPEAVDSGAEAGDWARRATRVALPPAAAPTSRWSLPMLTPGALISTATWWTSPSLAETWAPTTMSMPPRPSGAEPA